MADLRFHNRTGPHSLAQIASASECVLMDNGWADKTITDVAALDAAGPDELSFLDNPKYRDTFLTTKAGACIVSEAMAAHAPQDVAVLVSKSPYRSYALAATLFYPGPVASGISKQANIDPTAKIGEGTTIEAGAYIGPHVQIGKNCYIGANAVITHAVIGQGVRIYRGTAIGQEGFGFAMGPKGHLPVPQLGRVMIGDFCHIGANTCIDRGAGPDTIIGMGCIIDNLVQIAHNVKMGRGCVIAAQVGISGSTELGDFVVMGGQVGAAGHLNIGMGARIAAQSGVTKDVPAGQEWVGFPAQPRRAYWKAQAMLKKLLSKHSSEG